MELVLKKRNHYKLLVEVILKKKKRDKYLVELVRSPFPTAPSSLSGQNRPTFQQVWQRQDCSNTTLGIDERTTMPRSWWWGIVSHVQIGVIHQS